MGCMFNALMRGTWTLMLRYGPLLFPVTVDAIIAGMFIGDCHVTDPQSVSVSYPDFIAEMNNHGARISTE